MHLVSYIDPSTYGIACHIHMYSGGRECIRLRSDLIWTCSLQPVYCIWDLVNLRFKYPVDTSYISVASGLAVHGELLHPRILPILLCNLYLVCEVRWNVKWK